MSVCKHGCISSTGKLFQVIRQLLFFCKIHNLISNHVQYIQPTCISIKFVLLLCVNRFSQGLRLRQVDMLQEGITGSSATLSKLAYRVRRVCKSAMRRMRRRGQQKIGTRHEIVLIDESKFGHKRKVLFHLISRLLSHYLVIFSLIHGNLQLQFCIHHYFQVTLYLKGV